jgi:hypothetical protein
MNTCRKKMGNEDIHATEPFQPGMKAQSFTKDEDNNLLLRL